MKQPGMPSWVKASLIAVGVLLALFTVMIALGHNPLIHVMGHAGMAG